MNTITSTNLPPMATTQQLAEYLGLQVGTIEKARSIGAGDFPPYVRFGRAIRYRLADVLAWEAAHVVRHGEVRS